MACLRETHAVDAGSSSLGGPEKLLSGGYIDGRWPAHAGRTPTTPSLQRFPAWADRKIVIQRVYRRALACCNGADVDHAVDAGQHRLRSVFWTWPTRKNLIQRVYRRAMACTRGAYADHAVAAAFSGLGGQENRYPEGISTGIGLLKRGSKRTHRRRRPPRLLRALEAEKISYSEGISTGVGLRARGKRRPLRRRRPSPSQRALEAKKNSYSEGISTGIGLPARGQRRQRRRRRH